MGSSSRKPTEKKERKELVWIKSTCQEFQESWDSTEIGILHFHFKQQGLEHLISAPASYWASGHQCTLHPDNDLAQELSGTGWIHQLRTLLAATEQVTGGGTSRRRTCLGYEEHCARYYEESEVNSCVDNLSQSIGQNTECSQRNRKYKL